MMKTFLVFSSLWVILTQGSFVDWYLGLITVMAATLAYLGLRPKVSSGWSLWESTKFLPYFLVQSAGGGWDVARRVFHPGLPVKPGLIDFHFRLKGEFPRVFTCWVISLLPGTACVAYSKNKATIHVLDESMPNAEALHELERRVGAIFGELFELT